jgi:hypothetical protein
MTVEKKDLNQWLKEGTKQEKKEKMELWQTMQQEPHYQDLVAERDYLYANLELKNFEVKSNIQNASKRLEIIKNSMTEYEDSISSCFPLTDIIQRYTIPIIKSKLNSLPATTSDKYIPIKNSDAINTFINSNNANSKNSLQTEKSNYIKERYKFQPYQDAVALRNSLIANKKSAQPKAQAAAEATIAGLTAAINQYDAEITQCFTATKTNVGIKVPLLGQLNTGKQIDSSTNTMGLGIAEKNLINASQATIKANKSALMTDPSWYEKVKEFINSCLGYDCYETKKTSLGNQVAIKNTVHNILSSRPETKPDNDNTEGYQPPKMGK